MGSLLEVLEVQVEQPAAEPLLGASIDAPARGRAVAAAAFPIGGWVLGVSQRVRAIELTVGSDVVAVVPVDEARPDIGEAFPEAPAAQRSGFGAEVDLDACGGAEIELTAWAVVRRGRVRIGSLLLRRCWREELHAGDRLPLVSVVVACDHRTDAIGRTLGSVLAQRHRAVEVLLVDDGTAANAHEIAARHTGVRCVTARESGPVAARNEGLRRSTGDLVTFLDAGAELRPDALGRAVIVLGHHPEVAGVVDLPEDGAGEHDPHGRLLARVPGAGSGPAIYRRSAFEGLGGFDPASGALADDELALRAARRWLLAGQAGLVTATFNRARHVPPEDVLPAAAAMLDRELEAARHARVRRRAVRRARRAAKRRWAAEVVEAIRADAGAGRGLRTLRRVRVVARHRPASLLRLVGLGRPQPGRS